MIPSIILINSKENKIFFSIMRENKLAEHFKVHQQLNIYNGYDEAASILAPWNWLRANLSINNRNIIILWFLFYDSSLSERLPWRATGGTVGLAPLLLPVLGLSNRAPHDCCLVYWFRQVPMPEVRGKKKKKVTCITTSTTWICTFWLRYIHFQFVHKVIQNIFPIFSGHRTLRVSICSACDTSESDIIWNIVLNIALLYILLGFHAGQVVNITKKILFSTNGKDWSCLFLENSATNFVLLRKFEE